MHNRIECVVIGFVLLIGLSLSLKLYFFLLDHFCNEIKSNNYRLIKVIVHGPSNVGTRFTDRYQIHYLIFIRLNYRSNYRIFIYARKDNHPNIIPIKTKKKIRLISLSRSA